LINAEVQFVGFMDYRIVFLEMSIDKKRTALSKEASANLNDIEVNTSMSGLQMGIQLQSDESTVINAELGFIGFMDYRIVSRNVN